MKLHDYSKIKNPFRYDKVESRKRFITYPGIWGTQVTEEQSHSDSGGSLITWTILEIIVLVILFNVIL